MTSTIKRSALKLSSLANHGGRHFFKPLPPNCFSAATALYVECRLVKFCQTKWNGIKTQLLLSYIGASGKNIAHDENKYSKFFLVDIVCGLYKCKLGNYLLNLCVPDLLWQCDRFSDNENRKLPIFLFSNFYDLPYFCHFLYDPS